jgi:hypothetical protein
MVFMKPIDTTRLTTDDDIDRLVTDVRAQVANELATGSHD